MKKMRREISRDKSEKIAKFGFLGATLFCEDKFFPESDIKSIKNLTDHV